MNRLSRLTAVSAVLTVLLSLAPCAEAQDDDLGVRLRLEHFRPDWGGFRVRLENTSRDVRITGFELPIYGGKDFDAAYSWSTTGVNRSVVSPDEDAYGGAKSKRIVINFSSFDPGDIVWFWVDIDGNSNADPRVQLFNNGIDTQNSIASITGSNGQLINIDLPDGPVNKSYYEFREGPQRRTLKVKSVVEAAEEFGSGIDPLFVDETTVTVNNGTPIRNIGAERTITVFDGDTVEITAPEVAYRDLGGVKLTNSVLADPTKIQQEAEERFTAIGISVNDVAQTGDRTLYRFEVEGDTVAVVKWQHDYALRIESDFDRTESPLRNEDGDPWAGPIDSQANGSPMPEAGQLHWIEKGTQVVAQVDGQYIDDFVHPDLDIRFVPYGYIAYGAANSATSREVDERARFVDKTQRLKDLRGLSTEENYTYPGGPTVAIREQFPFSVGQSPEERQQVSAFTMYGPAEIRYLWKIQYGVEVAVAGQGEPKIFATSVTDRTGQGVFWFDPGSEVTVASEISESAASDAQSLTGWLRGDGYYFDSTGEIDAAGNLTVGAPEVVNGNPVATWQPVVPQDSSYRGLYIRSLDRPARVLWTYGSGAIRVAATVGEYVFQDNQSLAEIFSNEPSVRAQPAPTNSDAAEQGIWDPVAKKFYPLVESTFAVDWVPAGAVDPVKVTIDATWPTPSHYPHVANTPAVALDPDPNDDFLFKGLKFSENSAVIDEENRFSADQAGKSVLLFAETQRVGRGQPREFLRVRVVETKTLNESLLNAQNPRGVVIGKKIIDPELDLARLETGYLVNSDDAAAPTLARYNPFIYDSGRLVGIAAKDVYDTELLFADASRKVVTDKGSLPGPIIPVNLFPDAASNDLMRVVWYDDPARNDGLLWPHRGRYYQPRWPQSSRVDATTLGSLGDGQADSLGRIADRLAGASDVQLVGNLAFVTSATDDALTILDVSDPLRFQLLSQSTSSLGGFENLDGAAEVAVSGELAAVAAPSSHAVTFIDIANPVVTRKLAVIKDGENGFDNLGGANSVVLSGDLAFVGAGGDNAVSVVDLSDPRNPRLLAVIEDGVGGFTGLGGVSSLAVRSDILYAVSSADGVLSIIDVGNPLKPELLSSVPNLNGAQGLALAGDHVFIARAAGGLGSLSIVDVSDTEEPSIPATVAVAGPAQDVEVTGEFALVAVGGSGLSIVTVGEPSSPRVLRTVPQAASSVSVGSSLTMVTRSNRVAGLEISGDQVGRIVIATQWGSESEDPQGSDQLVAPAASDFARATTYDPSRFQQVQIYSQPDPEEAGYNPNEEHALIAPSLRFAQVSPRPPAAYALRDNDLNVYPGSRFPRNRAGTYTSDPFVLVQFFDTADEEFKMNVYRVQSEDRNAALPEAPNSAFETFYRFADIPAANRTASRLAGQPYVRMEAGEPVIPFYPLGVVDGAAPCPNTYGTDLLDQKTYWEDHRGSNWAISGGNNAWFSVSPFYRMTPDFWWPEESSGEPRLGSLSETRSTQTATFTSPTSGRTFQVEFTVAVQRAARVFPGDCVTFLPADVTAVMNASEEQEMQRVGLPNVDSVEDGGVTVPLTDSFSSSLDSVTPTGALNLPTEILYKSDWPETAPVLKAGETLTFSGGEYRADNPTTQIVDEDGDVRTIDTPGLPQVTAFAAAEVVFDSLNPNGNDGTWRTSWTARVAQVLDVRRANLAVEDFPSVLQPANGKSRVESGKFLFVDLPASLQKRIRYNPLSQFVDSSGRTRTGKLEVTGLLNDKDIGDPSLTAPPPAVYVLEPNILTRKDADALKALDGASGSAWDQAVEKLLATSRNPGGITPASSNSYLVGLERKIKRNTVTGEPLRVPIEAGSDVLVPDRSNSVAAPLRAYGPGLALLPNQKFLDPSGKMPGTSEPYPEVSWVTVVENNDPSLGGSPITPHVIKVDRRERYRGAIKTVESDNVFDENLVLRHTGDFGSNTQKLFYEWWYRPDDGSLNVPPPDLIPAGQTNPWKVFPDPSGNRGRGLAEITLKGNPNAPEALIADSWWFVRYRHENEVPDGTNWNQHEIVDPAAGTETAVDERINFTWAGAGNSQPFEDFDLDGIPDFRAQLAQGWIKRVLDAVNPYEARIREFDGENPSTVSSMLQQLGPRFEGPVALNPDKNVIENVGLIELYETILKRGRDLTIDLSRPVSTPAIANALQLASTRLSDFYTLLGNEAYVDALDQTIGFGSDSVEYGSLAPAVHAFQNQLPSVLAEEVALLAGVDDFFARPVYNRLFWNFTKGEGEAAYALNYNITDINQDGFINEDDAMILYPQGHGDAWGHYLTALRNQYELLNHPFFNWVSRSEFYNLQDIVIKVDFLDERKFAQTAAAKAKAGSEIVDLVYRDRYVADPEAQWQGYTDSNADRAAGVQGWARRAGQGAYFDWVAANALLPSEHPNENLEGIQRVDRSTNADIAVISANMNRIQRTFDEANDGYNPLGLAENAVPFDVDPEKLDGSAAVASITHFEQIYERAVQALKNATATWDNANKSRNMLRKIGNSEREFRNKTFQQDLSYKNRLIKIFGKPYEGAIGPGNLYPAGYDGPDLALYMYVNVREINRDTVPGPTTDFAAFDDGALDDGDLFDALQNSSSPHLGKPNDLADLLLNDYATDFNPTFAAASNYTYGEDTDSGLFAVNYTDLETPKVPFENFTQTMPITAAGYTFQAPNAWGARGSTGELQLLINKMIQQEARIAQAIGKWDGLQGGIVREMRVISARIDTASEIRLRNEIFQGVKFAVNSLITVIETAKNVSEIVGETSFDFTNAAKDGVPLNLPIGGLAVGPGDALSMARAGIAVPGVITKTASATGAKALEVTKLIAELAFGAAELGVDFANQTSEGNLARREWLQALEDMIGDEPVLRIEIFREIQALRELSDRYRALLDEGIRLIDERQAFNKRVAAQTQRNRYQDMTFRVSRNHALQTYHDSREIAARYAYLAAKAYDYETNLAENDAGSPRALFAQIVRQRGLGQIANGEPQLSTGGLAAQLAWLKTNYDAQKGLLGFNNPQEETGKMSLRTEMMRILPSDAAEQPAEFPSPGANPDDVWAMALQDARVDDLWDVPEFRYHCRSFASELDPAGNHVPQPGLVFRFGTQILAGENFFGNPLSGGDQAYDPSNFSTKIRSAGIWFSDYQSDDVLGDLSEAPRVYLIPAGTDIMNIPTAGASPSADDASFQRLWDVVDQRIPVPLPAATSNLDNGSWIPLLDSLNGRLGEPRRFSSFRAYHNGSEAVDTDQLVYDSRLVGRSVWNTEWVLIIPGQTLNADPETGLERFVEQVSDIKLIFQTYGHSGG